MFSRKYLSVILITHNEAELLPDCLKSVSWADEIIILDSGSHDKTCHIAMEAGARVIQCKNWLGFGKQRQRAQSYAKKDYIFMLDADERVSSELRQSIMKILHQPKEINGTIYSCARKNLFLGRFMRHSGWYPDHVVRLYPRNKYHYNEKSLVHESIDTNTANIVILKGDLLHLTCRNLSKFQYKQLKYADSWALESYNNGLKCSIFTIITHTCNAFFKTWILQVGFLDGKHGFLLSIIKAQYTFNKYSILWALHLNSHSSTTEESFLSSKID